MICPVCKHKLQSLGPGEWFCVWCDDFAYGTCKEDFYFEHDQYDYEAIENEDIYARDT